MMIILGDKYDVPKMGEEGFRQLQKWYSLDVDVWDKRDEQFFAHETDHLSVASITRSRANIAHAPQDNGLSAVAKRLKDRDLHAAVLYHCCRLSASQMVFGDIDTSCPPLCADDLARILQAFKVIPNFWTQLCADPPKLSECLSECHPTIQTVLRDFTQARLKKDTYKFCDRVVWDSLIDEIQENTCEICALDYKKIILPKMRTMGRFTLSAIFG